jgi:hypothetical protein
MKRSLTSLAERHKPNMLLKLLQKVGDVLDQVFKH